MATRAVDGASWTCRRCGEGNVGRAWCGGCGAVRVDGSRGAQPPPVSARPGRGPDADAGRTILVLIGLNLLVQIVLVAMAVAGDMDPVGAATTSLVVALALYSASGLWVFARSRSIGVQPSVGGDTALVGAAEGFVVGAGLAILLAGILRLAFGSPVLDPTAALLAADGTVGLLLLGVLIIVVMAPLVEEFVFRGFLAEALRGRGRWEAIAVSSVAFSLMHLRFDQLRYYVFLGAALAIVYLRRGLIGSICAHAAFNGVVLAVALAATHGPAVEAQAAGARVTLPAAWSTRVGPAGYDLTGAGPTGSRVGLAHVDVATGMPPAGRLPPELTIGSVGVTVVELPAGRAMSAPGTWRGDDARVAMVTKGGRTWILVMAPGGRARDGGDFDAMLRSWRIP